YYGMMTDEIPVNNIRRIHLDTLNWNGEKRIALRFPYDEELIALARGTGAKWSNGDRCWHIPDGCAALKQMYGTFKGKAWIDGSSLFGKSGTTPPAPHGPKGTVPRTETPLGTEQLACLERMQRKLEIARYSPSTIRVYHSALKQLFL